MAHQTNFKPERILDKVRRHIKRRDTKAAEDRIMRQVRAEDRYCRFPLCGCGKLKLTLDVCHAEHRGIGGNPSLSRTTPEGLILLCRPRHRAHKFAIDKKTLRVEPLTDRGLRGPARWMIDSSYLADEMAEPLSHEIKRRRLDVWAEIARETAPHVFEPFTIEQTAVLRYLSEMTC